MIRRCTGERPSTLPLVLVLLSGLAASGATADERQPVRGITLSTHTDGHDWATDRIVPSLRQIRDVGAGWVAIHPYARIHGDGRVGFAPIDPDDPPQHVVRPIREAHALGLKILIKPHLAYWGSPFAWRGEIAFDDERAWQRFWQDYTRWIVSLAAVTHDADGFAVGTELDRTLEFEQSWRELIREVRRRSGVPLTYAANWSDYERVPFWDALDAIGIQAYFPLTEQADPAPAEIEKGWARWMNRLRTFSAEHGRPVVFTELGYSRSFTAPVRAVALPHRRRCGRRRATCVHARRSRGHRA